MLNPTKSSMPVLWWVKSALILCMLLFGGFYTLPSFLGNSADWPKNPDGTYVNWVHGFAESFLPASRINLGLDLKGGLSLTLNVEVEKAVEETLARSIERAREVAATDGIKTGAFKVNDDLSVTAQIEDPTKAAQFQKRIQEQTSLLLFEKLEGNELHFQTNKMLVSDFEKQVMRQAINTIRNRIDQFGVAEPNVFQAGTTRVVVELPGMTDIERAKQLLGNTAQLDFRLVSNKATVEEMSALLAEARKTLALPKDDVQSSTVEKMSQWLRENKKIPQGTTILLHREYGTGEHLGKIISTSPYLVDSHPRLTGELLEDAQAVQSVENFVPQYVVTLKFKPQGAKVFGDLTTEAVKPENAPNNQIAIVLDGNVRSAPSVSKPILGGNAQITMGRGGNLEVQVKEAQDLALVLRAGALPAVVKVVEERQIGPSEGAQNIRAGIISTIIAAILVVLLMVFIYGLAGVVANVAMLFNVLLILAFMALFGATLTLHGIAGIVLTMAIAVDGNVVINERIREEIRSGMSQKQAFYRGYDNSFKTLIDAHVTSAVAGIVLVMFGNPAVKGFAVTLLCGIVCTLFTSYYVTEVIGQWLIEKTNFKRFG